VRLGRVSSMLTSPWRTASAAASRLEWTPSLTSTFWTWVRTVLSDRKQVSAMRRLDQPQASMTSTWRSRSDRLRSSSSAWSSRSGRAGGGSSAAAHTGGGSGMVTRKPAATARMASASSRADTARVMPAWPPESGRPEGAGRASSANSSTLVVGRAWPTRRTSSVTAGPGIWVSTTSTSGRWVRTACRAEAPSPARATTSRSSSAERTMPRPSTNASWSSARTTRTGCRIAAPPGETPIRC
jgi:hypothetical protein